MRLEHHLVGGYVCYISPHIIIIIMYVRTCPTPLSACAHSAYTGSNEWPSVSSEQGHYVPA